VRASRQFAGAILPHLTIIAIYPVCGISGSRVADVAVVGSVIRDELRRRPYRLQDGAVGLAASAATAATVPPRSATVVGLYASAAAASGKREGSPRALLPCLAAASVTSILPRLAGR
jgi:TRAP-type C4-dicarboxylate transport system permease large subunit